MKFSFSLIKKLIPKAKNNKELIRKLNLHSFEVADLGRGIWDVSIPANRFSDLASHIGVAREIAAILNSKLKPKILNPKQIQNFPKHPDKSGTTGQTKPKTQNFKVLIQDKNLCPRYAGQYFENIKVAPSPKWIRDILTDCGLKPINNVVDITNYVMLETGQPLHAFDFDKITQINADLDADKRGYIRVNPCSYPCKSVSIVIRRAKKGEEITTLDDKTYKLNENVLLIADSQGPLAIAGIKGGKKAEVDKKTKRIIIEAANFNGVNIYKSSKFLKLSTDASLRFSHNISPELVAFALRRISQLLQEIVGAKAGGVIDVNYSKLSKKIIKFDIEKFNRFIGINLDFIKISKYLRSLDFKIIQDSRFKGQDSFLVEPPILRQDIKTFEDVAEEVIRLYGYNQLKSLTPQIHLHPSGFEDQIVLKDKIRKILIGMGLDEVCDYSFISEIDGKRFVFGDELVALENPISREFYYLRPSLVVGLLKNVEHNFKFFDEVRIFEIGKNFFKEDNKRITEKLILGIAIASKNKETFFELKGLIEELFRKSGLVDYLIVEPENKKGDRVKDFTKQYLAPDSVLKIESSNTVFGYLGQLKSGLSKWKINFFEIDLDVLLKLVIEEHEYQPLPKYPSIMRDISVLVDESARVGEIMQAIQQSDLKYIEDVDLIDEYDLTGTNTDNTRTDTDKIPRESVSSPRRSVSRRSLTFRIVFQAKDRTLTDEEVNGKIRKINNILKRKFKVLIR